MPTALLHVTPRPPTGWRRLACCLALLAGCVSKSYDKGAVTAKALDTSSSAAGETSARIYDVLGTLTEREKKVLRLRFGIGDGYPRTLEEVGAIFKVTRERVRQIEAKALRKLRHPTRSRRLKNFLAMGVVE